MVHKTVIFCLRNARRLLQDKIPSVSYPSYLRKKSTYLGPNNNGLSYISQPGEVPYAEWTVGKLIDRSAEIYGDEDAVVFYLPQPIRRTFRQLKEEVDQLAAGLLSLGLEKGDRVGMWGPNSYQWFLTHKATMKGGLVMVNINPAYQSTEIGYCLKKVGVKCLVISEPFKGSDYYQLVTECMPEILKGDPGKIKAPAFPQFTTLVSLASSPPRGSLSFEEVKHRGGNEEAVKRLREIESLVQFDDVCNLQFTSGTTGNPKGVMLSHHNLVNNGYLVGRRFGYSPKDKLCLPVPLFHCFGSVAGVFAGISAGSSCVFPSPGFSPSDALKAVTEERCTVIYGTPTMHIDIINSPSLAGLDVSSLRLAVTAGAICPEELIRQMKKDYTVDNVGSCYGMTETSPVSFQSLANDSDQLRAETVGYPLENTEVKIIDKDGRIVKVGESGEMCIRGYLNMLGYWEDPVKTAETIDTARWLHTGDLMVMTETGHAKVVGRLKDMIIRGGENIYPREVEEYLHSHPKVLEAHVFGIPCSRMGEEVAVWISLKQGQVLSVEEIKEFCKGKIAHFKIPRHIHFTTEFPKTLSGKIQKFKLREMTVKQLEKKS